MYNNNLILYREVLNIHLFKCTRVAYISVFSRNSTTLFSKMKLAVYLLVRFYGKNHGVNQLHFFRAKCAVAFFLFMNVLSVFVVLDDADNIPNSDNQWLKKLFVFLMLLPFYLSVSFFVKKPAVHELHRKYKNQNMKVAYSVLVAYAILSLALAFISPFWAKSQH